MSGPAVWLAFLFSEMALHRPTMKHSKQGHPTWSRILGVQTFALYEGHGPPLVLFPGLGCSTFYFKRLREILGLSFTVWSFDPAGLGLSHAPNGRFLTISELADHFAQWLSHHHLEGVPVFGHSLGAEVLIDVAFRYPHCMSQLILCAPSGIPEHPSLIRQFLGLLGDFPKERPAFLFRAFRSYIHTGPSRVYALACNQYQHNTAKRLPYVHMPTLVLVGGRDSVTPLKWTKVLSSLLPHAQLKVIAQGPHALHDSHAFEVAGSVRRFLQV